MNAPWRIELLGGLCCRYGTTMITRFRSHNIAALLAYLALHGRRAHSREELADLLWPDADPDAARTNLRVALASLRRQMEPPGVPAGAVLVADRAHVRLNPEAVCTDVAEFEATLRRARGEASAEEQAALLEKAVWLYGGPLLPGFYETWVLTERDRLAQEHVGALHRLAAHAERQGDLERALEMARRAVAADPLNETSHAHLIRLFGVSGQPAAARRQYKELERLLGSELGAVPSPAVRALAEQAPPTAVASPLAPRAAPPPPATRAASASPRPAPHPPARLPLSFTRFFGREAEIEAVAGLLRTGKTRLVTVTGPGGSGKTRLSIEAAKQLAPAFAGRVFFVPLADLADAHLIGDAILQALDAARAPGVPWRDPAVEALAVAPTLLVLDNFEQFADTGTPLIADLLTRLPHLSCLVTSRQRLLLDAEREFPLPPLPTPPRTGPPERPAIAADLLHWSSVQLFVDRAQAARPDFQLTPRNAASVAALCACLEGLPLAIELAAAWSQTLTPAQMLARLEPRAEAVALGGAEPRLDLLVSRRRDLPPRHRSLRAALESSYGLLTPALQRFFAALSVFRGGWTLEAAEAVCPDDDAADALRRLRERSLLQTHETDGAMRFTMLETIRAFAREQLSSQDQAACTRRHAAFFVALAEASEAHLRGPEQAAWLMRLEAEHDNLRAVLGGPERAAALRLAGALGRFWFVRGYWTEGSAWLAHALASDGDDGDVAARARALLAAATMAWVLDRYEEASRLAEQGLRLYRQQDDRVGIASSLALQGRVTLLQGNHAGATALLEQSVAEFRKTGDRWGLAQALDMLAFAARDAGEYGRAEALHGESLAHHQALGDPQGMAAAVSNLGDVAQLRGDWEQAARLHAESLERFREPGDKSGIAYALCKLGVIALRQGDVERAESLHRESLALSWELRDKRRVAESLEQMAEVRRARGQNEAAARLLAAADALRATIGAPLPPGEQADFERSIAQTRAALDAEIFAGAWARGQAMPLEEAVADALEEAVA